MRILLIGDYSNVHWTLAEGLRSLGHEVCVASDGDGWKNYHRDINLKRRSLSFWDSLTYVLRILWHFRKFRGYDVVQLVNPIFLDLRARWIRPFYKYLRRHNRRVFLAAYGMDHYWVKTCLDCTTFRYSDFNLGSHPRTDEHYNQTFIRDWLNGEKTDINRYIASDCDGIITGLYEYDRCYRPVFPHKTTFIPFPIDLSAVRPCAAALLFSARPVIPKPVRFFIGIQRDRSDYKGTDIMLRALRRIQSEFGDACTVEVAESVPYSDYCTMMDRNEIILDQLYSYTPAMNALVAMAKGLVVVGGGEPENYQILGETHLRPIINVLPDEDHVYQQLRNLMLHPEQIPILSLQSMQYVRTHHDHLLVARRYLDAWTNAGR